MAASSTPSSRTKTLSPLDHIKKFIELMIEIYRASENKAVRVTTNKVNPFLRFMEDYLKIVENTKCRFDDHKELFLELFRKHRAGFLSLLDDDDGDLFIVKGDLQVWYGFDVPRIKRKNLRLPISSVYAKAHEMRAVVEKKLTGNDPDLDAELMSQVEYIFPIEFQYYLTKIIHLAMADDDPDYRVLGQIVHELHEESGLKQSESGPRFKGMSRIVDAVGKAIRKTGLMGDNMPNENVDAEGVGEIIANTLDSVNWDESIGDAVAKSGGDAAKNPATLVSKIAPALKETLVTVMKAASKPPDGVEVSADSQRQADEQAESMIKVLDVALESVSKIDMGGIMGAGPREEDQEDEASHSENEDE